MFPLLLAYQTVRLRKAELTRKSLRPAFYGQCFVAAPFILGCYIALAVGFHGDLGAVAGALLAALSLLWYAIVQTLWFVSLGLGRGRAALVSAGTILLGCAAVIACSAIATVAAQRLAAPA